MNLSKAFPQFADGYNDVIWRLSLKTVQHEYPEIGGRIFEFHSVYLEPAGDAELFAKFRINGGRKEVLAKLHLDGDGRAAFLVGDLQINPGIAGRNPDTGLFVMLFDVRANQILTGVNCKERLHGWVGVFISGILSPANRVGSKRKSPACTGLSNHSRFGVE